MTRKWLVRFSFSFIILGAVCAWEGYKSPHRATWWYVVAAVFVGAGLAGVRERHRGE